MRKGPRDVLAARQRTLFGADKLERLCADMAAELVLLESLVKTLMYKDAEHTDVSRETHHLERVKQWLLEYEDMQTAEWNGMKERLNEQAKK